MTGKTADRLGLTLQLVGAAWSALEGIAFLFLGVILALNPFVGPMAVWVLLASVAIVAVGVVLYGVGSWLRGELQRPMPGPRQR